MASKTDSYQPYITWEDVHFDKPDDVLAKELGCSINSVKLLKNLYDYILHKEKKEKRKKKIEDWKFYFEKNKDKSSEEIADELGYDVSTINKKKKLYGIDNPRGRKEGAIPAKGIKKINIEIEDELYEIFQQFAKIIKKKNFKCNNDENTNLFDFMDSKKEIDINAVINIILYYAINKNNDLFFDFNPNKILNMMKIRLLKKYNIKIDDQLLIISKELSEYRKQIDKFKKQFFD